MSRTAAGTAVRLTSPFCPTYQESLHWRCGAQGRPCGVSSTLSLSLFEHPPSSQKILVSAYLTLSLVMVKCAVRELSFFLSSSQSSIFNHASPATTGEEERQRTPQVHPYYHPIVPILRSTRSRSFLREADQPHRSVLYRLFVPFVLSAVFRLGVVLAPWARRPRRQPVRV